MLGVLAQYGPAWASIAGTVVFGAVHAAVAPHVLTGRHGSPHLSVRGDVVNQVVSHRIPVLVIGLLVVMSLLTVALALILHADGARHAALLASVVAAALLLAAGPRLTGMVRRQAERNLATS